MAATWMSTFLLCVTASWAWPDDGAWRTVKRGGAAVTDGAGDGAGAQDLVPDPSGAVMAWTADTDDLYLRLHVALAPAPGPAWTEDTWGVLWDLDGDERPDALTTVGGTAPVVQHWLPGSDLEGPTGGAPWLLQATRGDARLVASPLGVWVDLAVDWDTVQADVGVDPTQGIRWVAVTAMGATPGSWQDVAGCAGSCAVLQDVTSSLVTFDADGDGWPLPVEVAAGTSPQDADSDEDGLIDPDDPFPVSCDGDGDGVGDGVEMGVEVPSVDTAPDGCFRADADPASTTDPAAPDSDGGGLTDGQEDRNGDGAVDAWESDPRSADDDADADGDGLADVVEERTDGGGVDIDGDSVADRLDSDNDGVAEGLEGVADPDGDGLPAFRDVDADGDGLEDGDDTTSDFDGDGLPAHLDTDADGDGIPDGVEGTKDYDRDGAPNHLDLDADGDGRLDADEGTADLDCDGRPDFLDVVTDDGFCDTDLPRGDVDDGPFDGRAGPADPVTADDFASTGCASVPAASPWVALLGLGLMGLRRRRQEGWR